MLLVRVFSVSSAVVIAVVLVVQLLTFGEAVDAGDELSIGVFIGMLLVGLATQAGLLLLPRALAKPRQKGYVVIFFCSSWFVIFGTVLAAASGRIASSFADALFVLFGILSNGLAVVAVGIRLVATRDERDA